MVVKASLCEQVRFDRLHTENILWQVSATDVNWRISIKSEIDSLSVIQFSFSVTFLEAFQDLI